MVYIRRFRAASWSYIIEKNTSQRTEKKKSKGKKMNLVTVFLVKATVC